MSDLTNFLCEVRDLPYGYVEETFEEIKANRRLLERQRLSSLPYQTRSVLGLQIRKATNCEEFKNFITDLRDVAIFRDPKTVSEGEKKSIRKLETDTIYPSFETENGRKGTMTPLIEQCTLFITLAFLVLDSPAVCWQLIFHIKTELGKKFLSGSDKPPADLTQLTSSQKTQYRRAVDSILERNDLRDGLNKLLAKQREPLTNFNANKFHSIGKNNLHAVDVSKFAWVYKALSVGRFTKEQVLQLSIHVLKSTIRSDNVSYCR